MTATAADAALLECVLCDTHLDPAVDLITWDRGEPHCAPCGHRAFGPDPDDGRDR